jgi:hypothetical protein
MSQLLLPEIEFKLDPPFITALVLIITLVITTLTYLRMRKTQQIKLAHDFFLYYIRNYKRNVQNWIIMINQNREKSGESGQSGISTT